MDILTHIIAGIAVSSSIAVCMNGRPVKRIAIIGAGALGGGLPDLDAISMWSKFDATFGRLFHLSHTGREIYSAKFWYSHHAFMHSLAASVLFALLLLVTVYFINRRFNQLSQADFVLFLKKNRIVAAAFVSGYFLHLICDMPTPASSWGGVNLFFPLDSYVGGWGKIWWWNNYDLFLIISLVIVVNFILLAISMLSKYRFKYLPCILFLIVTIAVIIQINTRKFDFNSAPYQSCETRSKEIQEKILGRPLYEKMKKLDSTIPLHF